MLATKVGFCRRISLVDSFNSFPPVQHNEGEAVAGVMYMPFVDDEDGNGRTIFGMRGVGAFGFQNKPRNDGQFIMATTRTHGSREGNRSRKQMISMLVVFPDR